MPTTSFSNAIASPTGQSLGRVQADGFYSPLVAGVPFGPNGVHSTGPAVLPFGEANTVAATITAHSGGAQTNAVPLTSTINVLTTVAAAGDSVILVGTVIGYSQKVINRTATSANVFPPTGGTIQGGSANAASALAANTAAVYNLVAVNTWVIG